VELRGLEPLAFWMQNQIFCVFLRRLVSPDEASTCGYCRWPSAVVARSLTPLALCLALLVHPSDLGGGVRGRVRVRFRATAT